MLRFEEYPLLLQVVLWAWLPVLIMLLIWTARWRKKMETRLGDPSLLERLSNSISKPRRRFKEALKLLGFLLLIIAAFGPKFSNDVVEVKREGVDIIISLDVSNSMLAQDITPSRLEKAKYEIRKLIAQLRGDRIGLCVFAGRAYLQTPLTLDYAAFNMFLDLSDENTIGVQGTALEDAIATGIQAFDPDDKKHRVMMLISDGEDHQGNLDRVLDLAQKENVTIYTAGIGTLHGTPIPMRDAKGNITGYKKTPDGEVVTTKLATATLEEIARATGGRFIHLNATGNGLENLYQEILGMDKKEFASHEFTNFKEQYHWFAWFGLVCFILEFLLSDLQKRARGWGGELVHDE
ncbi:MAG: VWA domain-containing protein [Candidatus Marinimicrobia bacterium]|nr:VWA domain-containing protein [Candidatus Neomarinimicrobiota bacterium]MCF7839151.1 VWA domain-containing protein [Candidatus Neomarinimicrobiota bacterium]MCF7902430.1 VWA domain-containing protein [Candidatus Neomarinimicrobiota bacterium]